jgi:hypothetical protein
LSSNVGNLALKQRFSFFGKDEMNFKVASLPIPCRIEGEGVPSKSVMRANCSMSNVQNSNDYDLTQGTVVLIPAILIISSK